jgi:hypothetical protein
MLAPVSQLTLAAGEEKPEELESDVTLFDAAETAAVISVTNVREVMIFRINILECHYIIYTRNWVVKTFALGALIKNNRIKGQKHQKYEE